VCPSQRTIEQGIRQFVALLLSFCAGRGHAFPADSMHLADARPAHTRSPQVFLPPGGLDAFAKVPAISGRTSSRIERHERRCFVFLSFHQRGARNLLRGFLSGRTTGSTGIAPYLSPCACHRPPPSKRIGVSNISSITSNFNGNWHCRGGFHLVQQCDEVSGVPSTGATITVQRPRRFSLRQTARRIISLFPDAGSLLFRLQRLVPITTFERGP